MKSDRGNAVIEFIVIGLVAQLATFGFLVNLGENFRSSIAASAIARHTLRSLQMSGQEIAAKEIAEQIRNSFGLSSENTRVSVRNGCDEKNYLEVEVQVRGRTHVAKGFCVF